MKKHKILYVDDVFVFGGGEQHLLSLISKLDTDKFEISIACRKGSLLSQKGHELGCDIKYIKFRNKYDLFGLFSFYRILKQNRYDIVHL